jgi:Haem-NO-binding
MHGIVFQSLVGFLREELGVVRATAIIGGREHAPDETFPDSELSYLVDRAAGATGVEVDELYRAFGRYTGLIPFKEMFPDYYASHSGARSFLLGVEEEIHRVVRSTVAGAYPPHLRVVPLGALGVVITYTSERQLCPLLAGLVEGTAEHYGEQVTIEESQCMRRGDAACVFHVELAVA